MDKEGLYEARWYLLEKKELPQHARETLLQYLLPTLGPPPEKYQLQGSTDHVLPDDPEPNVLPVPVVSDDETPIYVKWLVPEGQYFPLVGHGFTPSEFLRYLRGIDLMAMNWNPVGTTIHHCWEPNLKQRPNGFSTENMYALRSFYKDRKKWSRGPHLFVDDKLIWVFSPLTDRAIHSPGFNATRFGIECLGNYDSEDPKSGRGLKVFTNAALATLALAWKFGLEPDNVNTHRDDPLSDGRTCAGKKFEVPWFKALMAQQDWSKVED